MVAFKKESIKRRLNSIEAEGEDVVSVYFEQLQREEGKTSFYVLSVGWDGISKFRLIKKGFLACYGITSSG